VQGEVRLKQLGLLLERGQILKNLSARDGIRKDGWIKLMLMQMKKFGIGMDRYLDAYTQCEAIILSEKKLI
jgi:hypothetical protein